MAAITRISPQDALQEKVEVRLTSQPKHPPSSTAHHQCPPFALTASLVSALYKLTSLQIFHQRAEFDAEFASMESQSLVSNRISPLPHPPTYAALYSLLRFTLSRPVNPALEGERPFSLFMISLRSLWTHHISPFSLADLSLPLCCLLLVIKLSAPFPSSSSFFVPQ